MKKVCIVLAAVLLAAIGCTKEEFRYDEEGNRIVTLNVNIPTVVTKSTDMSHENEINHVQVFLFNEGGSLAGYKYSVNRHFRFDCIAGPKDIVVIANAPQIDDITTFSELQHKVIKLGENKIGALLMYGKKHQDIVDNLNTVHMTVERLVAKILVKEVVNNLEMPQYQNAKFEVKKVFLVNVAGDREYDSPAGPKTWYNLGQLDATEQDVLILISSGDLNAAPTPYGKTCYIGNCLYCYPNPTTEENAQTLGQKPTRVVVEVAVDGIKYYYPITLPDLKANTCHYIRLIVKRLGSASPDVPVALESVSLTTDLKPWVMGFEGDVTI